MCQYSSGKPLLVGGKCCAAGQTNCRTLADYANDRDFQNWLSQRGLPPVLSCAAFPGTTLRNGLCCKDGTCVSPIGDPSSTAWTSNPCFVDPGKGTADLYPYAPIKKGDKCCTSRGACYSPPQYTGKGFCYVDYNPFMRSKFKAEKKCCPLDQPLCKIEEVQRLDGTWVSWADAF